jgi:ABC-type nitrate/sulfonate/bicarbonate transport system substrate-binding protein
VKKIISILCLVLVLFTVSCSLNEIPTTLPEVELNSEVSILVPSGTPYLAIAGLLKNPKIKIDISNGPSGLQTALPSGSHDIVIAPVNLGTNLYNKGNSKYQISHILTSNNAYIVTRSENKLDSIMDLANEKVLAFAATGIPANVLKKVYENNGLDISLIDFSAQSSAAVYSLFAGNTTDAKYVLMSEPEISKLILKDKIDVNVMDLTKVLDTNIAQACVYVNPTSENVKDINAVLNLMNEMVNYLNKYPESYADAVLTLDESRTLDAMGKDVIIHSIPLTNIVFKEAKTNKEDIESILNILGVTLPNAAFYR